MARLELSFCIPLMNRFDDIQATLAQNLADNRGSIGRVEFILICFDSDDLVEKWVKANFQDYIESKFLRFYRSSDLNIWHFSKAKNAFKKFIKSRIYASLDGDNYTGFQGGEHIINVFQQHDYNCILHQFQGDWGDGTCGRVALRVEDYIEIGYDNCLLPRQWDELDAMLSIMVRHPERKYVCYKGKSIINKSFPFRRFITENFLSPMVVEIDERLDPLYEELGKQAVGLHDNNYVDQDLKLKYSNIFNHLSSFFKNTPFDHHRNQYVVELQEIQRTMVEVIDPSILERWVLIRQDHNGAVKIDQNDIILLSCIKDEPDLDHWYSYYTKLGVTKFFIIDDYSTRTIKSIIGYNNVFIWYPIVGRFRYAKVFWLEILLSCYCRGNWCLTVDSDEYISLPDFPPNPEKQDQSGLRRYIDVGINKGIEYFAGFLLDVFPGLNNFGRMPYNLEKCDFTNYQYRPPTLTEMYEQSNTVRWSYGENYSWAYQIDVRYRLNRAFDSLRKFPIFRYRPGIHLNQGFHDLIIDSHKRKPSELNRGDLIPIIHYKLRGLLLQKISGQPKDIHAYHQETSKNLNRIISNIEYCLLNAMISPFSHKYIGYNVIPTPNCQEIIVESGDQEVIISDVECVDRTLQKLVYVESNCQPYFKNPYVFGRSFMEVVNWIRQVTPFSYLKNLNEMSALLSSVDMPYNAPNITAIKESNHG